MNEADGDEGGRPWRAACFACECLEETEASSNDEDQESDGGGPPNGTPDQHGSGGSKSASTKNLILRNEKSEAKASTMLSL